MVRLSPVPSFHALKFIEPNVITSAPPLCATMWPTFFSRDFLKAVCLMRLARIDPSRPSPPSIKRCGFFSSAYFAPPPSFGSVPRYMDHSRRLSFFFSRTAFPFFSRRTLASRTGPPPLPERADNGVPPAARERDVFSPRDLFQPALPLSEVGPALHSEDFSPGVAFRNRWIVFLETELRTGSFSWKSYSARQSPFSLAPPAEQCRSLLSPSPSPPFL